SSSQNSPAATATGPSPFDPNRDLRIASRDPKNPVDRPSSSDPWKGRGVEAEGAPGQPVPYPPSAAAEPRQPIVPVGMTSSRIGSLDQGFAYIDAQGGVGSQLVAHGDTGEFVCQFSIPNPQNPNIRHTYLARAHDRLTAMRQAIAQMEKEQQE